MKMWVARNEGFEFCTLFICKPNKVYDELINKHRWRIDNLLGGFLCLPSEMLPEVTFENSPQQVEIKLVKNE